MKVTVSASNVWSEMNLFPQRGIEIVDLVDMWQRLLTPSGDEGTTLIVGHGPQLLIQFIKKTEFEKSSREDFLGCNAEVYEREVEGGEESHEMGPSLRKLLPLTDFLNCAK